MAIIPVRGLAKGGIILDQHPTTLPLPAFTGGRNVLFDNGKCMSAPKWRTVWTGLGIAAPIRFCAARTPASGFDEVIVCRDDASLARFHDKAIIEASEIGFTARSLNDSPWTSGFLGDVLYVNRPDGPPRSLKPGDTQFTVLPNWPSGWTCGVLRTFRDSLVALNVNRSGQSNPSTVDVSDVAYYQTVPGSWDYTDPTKLAYDSPLARLTGPIVDACALGDRFFIYSSDQVVEMDADSNFIYSFRELPFRDGALNANCTESVDGLQYVFGSRDLWVHDGQTKKSLAENRVRDAVYHRIDMSKRSRAFVRFLPTLNAIMFAYVSNSPEVAWTSPTGCNEAVVYLRSSDTWTVIDLPNVSYVTVADVNTALTWADMAAMTWDGFGGSWSDQDDGRNRNVLAVNNPLSVPQNATTIGGTGSLLAYDFVDRGRLALSIDATCTAPSFVDRIGVSLDMAQDGNMPLVVDKLVRNIYPEISTSRDGSVVTLLATGAATPFAPVAFPSQGVSFTPSQDYVVDLMVHGRYLAFRAIFPNECDTEFSGVDLDVVPNGRR